MVRKINRRDFLIKSSGTIVGAGLAFSSNISFGNQSNEKSKVVEIMHPGAVLQNRKIDGNIVRNMLRKGIEELTGSRDPWSKFFDKNDRVGLKINTLGGPVLYTHPELINAVAAELIEFGIKENNIIVWDYPERHLTRAGFEVNTSAEGIRYYGSVPIGKSSSDWDIRFDTDVRYESTLDNPTARNSGRTFSRMSTIFTKDCDKIINLPILKDHSITGLTLCLKNLAYGIMDNVARYHGKDHIGTFISDICALPIVKNKVVLHIADALEACSNQGPVPKDIDDLFTPKKLWFSLDPVAMDSIGYTIVDNERARRNLLPLERSADSVDHIALAADKGVGTNDPDRIDLRRINLS